MTPLDFVVAEFKAKTSPVDLLKAKELEKISLSERLQLLMQVFSVSLKELAIIALDAFPDMDEFALLKLFKELSPNNQALDFGTVLNDPDVRKKLNFNLFISLGYSQVDAENAVAELYKA